MTLADWIKQGLSGEISEGGEYYCCRRGMSDFMREHLGVNTWHPPQESCPDEAFAKAFGSRGEKLSNCLVFPYWEPNGNLVLLEMRDMSAKRLFKYAISSERHAYFGGIPWMMPYLWAGQTPIVVEGFFDMVALVRVYQGPVLVAGTANLNHAQEQFLSRWCNTVMLGFDMDKAGRNATTKVSRNLRDAGLKVLELAYTGYKDPGVVWDQGGQELLNRVFGQVVPVKGMQDGSNAVESW